MHCDRQAKFTPSGIRKVLLVAKAYSSSNFNDFSGFTGLRYQLVSMITTLKGHCV